MAIARDASSKATATPWSSGATNLSSRTWSHTCSGTDRYLHVTTGTYHSSTGNISGITYAGVAMTLLRKREEFFDGANVYIEEWGLVAPSTGANNIVVTWTQNINYSLAFAQSYTGVDQTTPIETGATAHQGSTSTSSPACTATVSSSGAWLIGGFISRPSTATITAGSGTSIIDQVSDVGIADSNGTVSTGTQGLAYTASTGEMWSLVVSVLKSASGGGGGSSIAAISNYYRMMRS